MNKFDLKAWTGPTCAVEIARACRDAGYLTAWAGTEHVYIESVEGSDAPAAAHNVRADLFKTHGKDFGLTFRAT